MSTALVPIPATPPGTSRPLTRPSPALHVHRVGSGEPLVLLHGLGESHIGWHPVIDTLAADYDVIAVDLPGFGRSPALPATMAPTASNLAAAVQAAVEELGVGDYHVAGYYLGARVAIHMATTHSVQSLIAIAPDGLGTPLERVQGYLALIVGRATAIALAPLAGQLSRSDVGRSLFFAGTRSLPWQLTAADAHHLLTDFAAAPAYEATNWAAMFDSPTGLDRLTCPTLFLQGTADPLIAQQALRYPAFIAHAQLRWLPGLNHVPISDDPAAVAEHMLTFLHRPGPAATSTWSNADS